MAVRVPNKPTLEGLEEKWATRWEADGTYRFDRSQPADRVFAIDTPPPTVSGSLHIGHVYSYTHTDVIARFHRMRGEEVFYPIGWDDNGVPTERRVQNYYGVRCDPGLPYDPDFVVPRPVRSAPSIDDARPIDRPNFVALCRSLTETDEVAFEELWRTVGLSVDWGTTYTTIGDRARRVSQAAFRRLVLAGEAYTAEAPTLWDVDFGMAVSQAELEEREEAGTWHRLRFRAGGGRHVEIETTRPELLAACVALVAHPGDERYRDLVGTAVVSPVFGVSVPVLAHPLAEPDKGSGIAMICTFGDVTDVTWWRELGLPVRVVVGRDGRMLATRWGQPGWESEDPERAQAASDQLVGLRMPAARTRIAELLEASGDLVGTPRPLAHAVKFYEKGQSPLEIVASRQWFVRVLAHRDELLERGRELVWHPPFMRVRYQSWVEGLGSDWNISRQRYFGVPFPVWYPLGPDGATDYEHPLLADEASLPVDPSTDVPGGYEESQRGRANGFVADPDVMDTWATSSLTPQIAGGWLDDPALFAKLFPFTLRAQAQDIIRTWTFTTMVRAELEHHSLPWRHAAISGFIVDPDRKKMSKSQGNVVTPMAYLERHGTDAVRYWAALGGPGMDTVADEGQMKIGRRLAIKLLNASRFVLSLAGDDGPEGGGPGGGVITPLDRSLLARLGRVVEEATSALEGYEYSRALERVETFFWSFCDDYLELVKTRAYGRPPADPAAAGRGSGSGDEAIAPGQASALLSLTASLSVLQRCFAPFIPYVSEEVWSWWQEGSVHRASWPQSDGLRTLAGDGDPLVFVAATDVLGQVRKAKTETKRSMRAAVRAVRVADVPTRLAAIEAARGDIMDAGNIAELVLTEGPAFVVEVDFDDA